MAEHMRAMQADTGTETMLQGQEFDDPRGGEIFFGAKQRTQQELVGLCVERSESEEGMLHCGHLCGW